MRFLIEYKDFKTKQTTNPTLKVLETFLNEHLIRTFHGDAFECIYIHFISNVPARKKTLKERLLYGSMAEMEIILDFIDDTQINIEDFQCSLHKVEELIKRAANIQVKEGIHYNKEILLQDYNACLQYAPATLEELRVYAKDIEEINKHSYAKRVNCLMEQDKQNPRPLTKLLEEFVVLDPYDLFGSNSYRYSELFSNLLRSAGVYLPDYSQLHVHIAENMVIAKQELALEPWYKLTYAKIDLNAYQQGTKEQKEKMLLESIAEGLRYIADVDHLDKEKIADVIAYVEKNGIDVELVYFTKENKKYKAEIIYHVPKDHLTATEYILRVTDLRSNQIVTAHIDFIKTFTVGAVLRKIVFAKEEIVIKGSNSYRAELSRKSDKLPNEYKFNIEKLFQA